MFIRKLINLSLFIFLIEIFGIHNLKTFIIARILDFVFTEGYVTKIKFMNLTFVTIFIGEKRSAAEKGLLYFGANQVPL